MGPAFGPTDHRDGAAQLSTPNYKDYYKILGVSKTADDREIKAAYRKLARRWHPDVNPGNPEAEARFKEISEANDVLSDPEKRSVYDRYGDQWRQVSQQRERAPGGQDPFGQGAPFGFPFGQGGGPDLSSLFESIFAGAGTGPFRRDQHEAAGGGDVEFAVEISLQEAATGITREISLTLADTCSACRGMGGTRRGRIDIGSSCPQCRGTGHTNRSQKMRLNVPAGVSDGKRIRYSGKGAQGPGGRKGDLDLIIRILPDPRFERIERDLYVDVDVPYTVAAMGGDIQVPSLTGTRPLPLPGGVRSGQLVRVSGQGLPNPDGKPGDLYARLRVTVPRDLAPRERALLAELAAIRGDTIRQ